MARKNTLIRYTSRDFASIKEDLIQYAKKYYPDTFKDFNEAGFGSLMLDTTSYIGDILSFYLDYQANESFLDTSIEYNNVIRHGKRTGYKFNINPSSFGVASFYVVVPSDSSGMQPSANHIPILRRGSEFSSGQGNFILMEDVNFASADNQVVVATVDNATGLPTAYAIKAYGQVISGKMGEEYKEVGTYQRFLKIELDTQDITEILSVVDSEGHEYFEVDYLTQNTVYRPVLNRDSTTNTAVPNIMRAYVVPRRFATDRERRKTSLQFGYGTSMDDETFKVLDPARVILNMTGKDYVSDAEMDPSRLLQSDKLGVVPTNTTLRVTFRYNTADNVNVAVGGLKSAVTPKFVFPGRDSITQDEINQVVSSLEVSNEDAITGDVSLPTVDELKKRIVDVFSAQNRAVTKQDYCSLVYSMPSNYGSVKRVNIFRDSNSNKRNLNMYIISEASDGTLIQANDVLKQNVRTWLLANKMINDTVDILDAKIINLGVEFEVVGDLSKSRFDVLKNCMDKLVEKFAIIGNIGEDFAVTDIYEALKSADGVVDVSKVKIKQKQGGIYSDIAFDVWENTSKDGRFISCPENAIFEIKYPYSDFVGAVK